MGKDSRKCYRSDDSQIGSADTLRRRTLTPLVGIRLGSQRNLESIGALKAMKNKTKTMRYEDRRQEGLFWFFFIQLVIQPVIPKISSNLKSSLPSHTTHLDVARLGPYLEQILGSSC